MLSLEGAAADGGLICGIGMHLREKAPRGLLLMPECRRSCDPCRAARLPSLPHAVIRQARG